MQICNLLLKIVQACSEQKTSANGRRFSSCLQASHRQLITTSVALEQCFLVVGTASGSDLLAVQSSSKATWVDNIRHLLVSINTNDVHLFLVCLDCIEPKLWAGTTPDIPAVLEGWEVERVMQLLSSADPSIRVRVSGQSYASLVTDRLYQTLRILLKVDVHIVETYYTQSLQIDRTLATAEELFDSSVRLMEMIDVLYGKDGESYAHGLLNIISALTPQPLDGQTVLQNIVEDVLIVLREGT